MGCGRMCKYAWLMKLAGGGFVINRAALSSFFWCNVKWDTFLIYVLKSVGPNVSFRTQGVRIEDHLNDLEEDHDKTGYSSAFKILPLDWSKLNNI